jgi:hypothetical protein
MVWIEVNGGNSADALNVNENALVCRVLLVNLLDGWCVSNLIKRNSIISPRAFGAWNMPSTYGLKVSSRKR